MWFYSLYGLLWRRMTILFVLSQGFAVAIILFTYPDQPFPGIPTPSRLNFLSFFFAAMVGNDLGQGVRGLQHTLISWTLPNLRRRQFFSLLLAGIATAFIVTWAYRSLGGPGPTLPIFTSALLWYSMGVTVGRGQVPDFSTLGVRASRVSIFTLSLLVVAGFSINPIVDYYGSQTHLCVLLTLLGATLFLLRNIAVKPARRDSMVSIKELTTPKDNSRRQWKLKGPITGLLSWIRAGEYENLGLVRGGWPAVTVGISATAVLCVISMAYYMGYKRESHEIGILYIYQAIFDPSSIRNMTVLVSIFPAMFICFHLMLGSLVLKGNLLYPLSRIELARLAYWGSFLHTTVFCGITLLVFYLVGCLAWLYADYETPFKFIPGFIRPLTLMYLFSPFLSWIHLRFGPGLISFVILWFLFAFGGGILGGTWLEMGTGFTNIQEILGCTALILLSQCLFRYKVERYFRTADLA